MLSLGCENLTREQFLQELGPYDPDRVKFLTCQEVEDEMAAGRELLQQLADYAGQFRRQPIPASELVVGMKCGGSDGLSGITANPVIGRFSDMLCARGGTTVLTEVPEMFGAEGFLMDRCQNRAVFDKAVAMINGFKDYFLRHGEVVYENPSPGNKAGGITTLEDKSCGCVQKGGSAPIMDVVDYGGAVTTRGLNLLSGPGNDLVSATALTAAGAHIILFSTGRGTPFGAPAPTLKIATIASWRPKARLDRLQRRRGGRRRPHAGRGCRRPVPAGAGDRFRPRDLRRAPRLPRDLHLQGRRGAVSGGEKQKR